MQVLKPQTPTQVVSIYMDLCITGFALPPPLDKMFDDLKDLIKEALEDTFSQTSKADNDKIAKCFPGGATKYVKDTAATVAATLITSLRTPSAAAIGGALELGQALLH